MLKIDIWFRKPSHDVQFYQDLEEYGKDSNYALCKRMFWQWCGESDVFKRENVHVFESEGGLVRHIVQYFEDAVEVDRFNQAYADLISGEPFNGICPQEHPDFMKYNEENGITTNFRSGSLAIEV